jgi:hypothetical protein
MFFKKTFFLFTILLFTIITICKCEELTEDNWRELLEGHEWMIEL